MGNFSKILRTIHIGIVIATFLLNTGRIIKAVDVFNECLIILNGKALKTIKELTTPVIYKYIYQKLLDGYTLMGDHTRAIEYGKKVQERYLGLSENMPRLKNIFIKHLPSRQTLATDTEKRHATET